MGYKSKIAERVVKQSKDIIDDYTALELIYMIPNAENITSIDLYNAINQVNRIFINLKIQIDRINVIRAVASLPLGSPDGLIIDKLIKDSEEPIW